MNQQASSLLKAPELRVSRWLDGYGRPCAPLKLADLGTGYRIIFCFQHWCPGCHSTGFPTMKRLVKALSPKGFGFAVVQTVFEGKEVNTFERMRDAQLLYDLQVPFGYDAPERGYPTIMSDYHTRGTPWFIVINPSGEPIYGGFTLDAEGLIASADYLSSVTTESA